MLNRQKKSKQKLAQLLVDHGIQDAIIKNRYREVIQRNTPSHKVPDGRSLIISYYDGNQYVCTIHQLRTREGIVVHQDVEDILIGTTRYVR